jgi:hypothetical protein
MRTRKAVQRAEADDQPEPRAQAMRVEAATDTLLPRERESRAATVTANLGVEPENESEPLPAEAAVEEMDNDPEDDADHESGTSKKGEDLTMREQSEELKMSEKQKSRKGEWEERVRRFLEGDMNDPIEKEEFHAEAARMMAAQQKVPGETLRAKADGPETSGTTAPTLREKIKTFEMLVKQGVIGEVNRDEADTKRPGRTPGTGSGTPMTGDEHIPRKQDTVEI